MIFNAASTSKTAAPKNAFAESFEKDGLAEDFTALLNLPNAPAKNFICQEEEIAPGKETAETPADENNLLSVSEFAPLENFAIQPTPNFSRHLNETSGEFPVADNSTLPIAPNAAPEQNFSAPNDKALPEKFQEFLKTNIENGKIEVLDFSVVEKNLSSQPQLFTAEKLEPVNVLPKLFGEISNIIKNENAPKSKASDAVFNTVFESDSSAQNPLAEQIKSNFSESNEFNFNPPQTMKPKGGKPLESATDFSAIGFNKVLDSVVKEQKIAQTSLPVKPHEVLEQVETQMVQLINLDKSESDKKVLKMRLHPAELGAVEVRLERNSDGKLHAHFQTENSATHQILNENLEHLRDSLQNSGWQIERLEISNNSSASPENGGRGNQPPQPFETDGNYQSSTSNNSATNGDDSSKEISANRLLSVRA